MKRELCPLGNEKFVVWEAGHSIIWERGRHKVNFLWEAEHFIIYGTGRLSSGKRNILFFGGLPLY